MSRTAACKRLQSQLAMPVFDEPGCPPFWGNRDCLVTQANSLRSLRRALIICRIIRLLLGLRAGGASQEYVCPFTAMSGCPLRGIYLPRHGLPSLHALSWTPEGKAVNGRNLQGGRTKEAEL